MSRRFVPLMGVKEKIRDFGPLAFPVFFILFFLDINEDFFKLVRKNGGTVLIRN